MSMIKYVDGQPVELAAAEEAVVRAEWAAEAKAAADALAAQAAEEAARTKAAADMGTFVAGMKAMLAQQAKQPGAAPEIQAAAAVDISAVDTVAILQP